MKAFELRAQIKTGQSLKFDGDGGGSVTLEFDEGAAANWFALRQDAIGRVLRILVELE
jgi:hypothetical protein